MHLLHVHIFTEKVLTKTVDFFVRYKAKGALTSKSKGSISLYILEIVGY
jgi:hypothetical protein